MSDLGKEISKAILALNMVPSAIIQIDELSFWFMYNGCRDGEMLGFLPEQILASDPRPVAEQIAERYAHGGGYRPGFPKGRLEYSPALGHTFQYPGDPPLRLITAIYLPITKEMFMLFEGAMVAIKPEDGPVVFMRMD